MTSSELSYSLEEITCQTSLSITRLSYCADQASSRLILKSAWYWTGNGKWNELESDFEVRQSGGSYSD